MEITWEDLHQLVDRLPECEWEVSYWVLLAHLVTVSKSAKIQNRHSRKRPVIPAKDPSFPQKTRHSRKRPVIPAKAGIQ